MKRAIRGLRTAVEVFEDGGEGFDAGEGDGVDPDHHVLDPASP